MIEQLKAALEEARSVALLCHISPDVDTLGSAVALRYILEAQGKRAVVYAQDEVPARYLFLEGLQDVRTPDEEIYDLALAVDVSDEARMGEAGRVFAAARSRAMIDHHRTTVPFAPIYVIRPQAAATAQIVAELMARFSWAVPPQAAMCLCAGMSTDTGNFSFDSVTGDTFRAAGACVDNGARVSVITERLYRTSTLGHVRMMGRVLSSLDLRACGRVALLLARKRDFDDCGATREDSEGIVNLALEIEGVQAAALLSEREGEIKCSLRAKEPLDVSAVAARFGGGGHIRAAGCSFAGAAIEEARERIAEALKEIVE